MLRKPRDIGTASGIMSLMLETLGPRCVADAINRSAQTVYAMSDPDNPAEVTVTMAAALDALYHDRVHDGHPFLELLASKLGEVSVCIPDQTPEDVLSLLDNLTQAFALWQKKTQHGRRLTLRDGVEIRNLLKPVQRQLGAIYQQIGDEMEGQRIGAAA